MKVLIVLALVAVAYASDSYTYRGRYPGKCGNDGLYFRDEKSFVFCSNGNSYVQPCAPGTRNSNYGKYSYGGKYGYSDFCDVNLVDDGYAAKNRGYGYNRYDGRRDYGYGYDRDYSYGRRDYGYGRRDYW